MRKLALFLSLVIFFTACGEQIEIQDTPETNQTQTLIPRDPSNVKAVEYYTFARETADLSFAKIGEVVSSNTIAIVPEIQGRITTMNVKIGNTVKKGQLIATLGESLSTSSSAIQANTAAQLKQIADEATRSTAVAGNIALQNAVLVAEQAYTSLLQLQDNRIQTEENLELQFENTEIEIENARLAKEGILEQIDDIEVRIWDLEDDQEDIFFAIRDAQNAAEAAGLQAQYDALESQINGLDAQLDNLEISADQARNRVEQAIIGYEQQQLAAQIQLEQIDNSINSAMIQYDQALINLSATEKQMHLQDLASRSQNIQADQASQLANLNVSARTIVAPANGIISNISFEEGSLVNPGQEIASISAANLKVIVELTADELENVQLGQTVMIDESIGNVSSINTIANAQNERFKIEITPTNGAKLAAGTQTTVKFPQASRSFIPLNAVLIDGDTYRVKTLNDKNRVVYKTIEAGEIEGAFIEVLSGLTSGERVITTTEIFLEEGERVNLK